MAANATPPIIRWKYNDWRLQPTAADQRARLIMHLQEAEGFVLESTSRGNALKLHERYVEGLQKQLDKLNTSLAIAGGCSHLGGVSKFVRGADA